VHIPLIDSARSKVTADMESMVLEGLSQVASSFPDLETRRFLNHLHRTSHFWQLHCRLRTTSACCRTSCKISSRTYRPRWKPGSKLRSTCRRYPKSLTQKVLSSCSLLCFQNLSHYLIDPASSSAGLAYKSRIRQEPTSVTAPQWANALWNRLSSLIEDMAGACVKVCLLLIYFWGRCGLLRSSGVYARESIEVKEGSGLADCLS
jgi:hypothetical protein